MSKLFILSTKLKGEIEINFRYKYVYAFTEKVNSDTLLTIQILARKQKEKTQNLKLLCLDFLAWITDEGFMLSDIIQNEIENNQSLIETKSNKVVINGEDKLKDLEDLVLKWENSNKKQRAEMIIKIRMNRYKKMEDNN